MYLGGSSHDKSFKETINFIRSKKLPPTFNHHRKDVEEKLLQQIALDEKRYNQDTIQQFWDSQKVLLLSIILVLCLL